MKNNTLQNIILDFYSELITNENHRFQSWEHCFSIFKESFEKESINAKEKDNLSLHLAFYLASWGMYRGSSFILQKDYKIFLPVIDLLIDNKDKFDYKIIDNLLTINDDNLVRKYVNDFFIFDMKLENLLENIRITVKGKINTRVSYTLKTKIIMGSYGSIPAYDRFFIDGLSNKKEFGLIKSYSKKGLFNLIKFAGIHVNHLKSVSNRINYLQNENSKLNKIEYPYMKLIDMYFWKIGYDSDQEKQSKK